MTIDEFYLELQRLENFYGKNYNDTQKEEIFKYFNNTSLARFKFILSKAYQKYKFLPALSELIELHKEEPFFVKKENIKKNKEICKVCQNKGFLLYKQKNEKTGIEYEYLAHCICQNGLKYTFDGYKVKDSRCKSNYYIPSVKEILNEL